LFCLHGSRALCARVSSIGVAHMPRNATLSLHFRKTRHNLNL
jgi:hypothetical protein